MTYKGNFRTIQTIQANEDGSLPTEIQVLPLGEWNTLPYGLFEVTKEHLRQMIANFKLGTRKAVPIDVDHDGGKAAGWVNELVAKDDGLWAMVEWTKYGTGLLEDKIYKLFSPEFSLNYVDPEYSTEHGAVFIAGSLVNRPLFKELKPITASEKPLTNGSDVVLLLGKESMNLDEIKTKTKEDLTQEEIDFLKQNVAELSDEEKAKFGLAEEASTEETTEESTEATSTEENESTEEETSTEETTDVKASENVTIAASELETLKAQAAAGVKASEELTKKKAEELIQSYVANDKGGKILDKDKGAFVDFYLKCSDEQKTPFEALIKLLPEIKIAGEIGKNEKSTGSAVEEVQNKIQEKIKASEGILQYDEALKLVTKENPDLIKRYEAELTTNK